ncbi:MAG: SRPBCC domain-containing protein [Pseudomonadales bacterium]|jgi:uncharacterized protein YndB with AHSA1/START domain|nr:SRPBCC domain-containing protein [Pseudomonadales bacterium]
MPLELTRENETTVLCRRAFQASAEQLCRAHTDADLMRQWMLGPEGWEITDCESDPQAGGQIQIVWRQLEGDGRFSLSGKYLLVDAPNRLVHVERMHLPDTTPDNRVETLFTAIDGGTELTLRMTLPDAAALDAMLESGMADGMEASYARLESQL